MRGGSRGEGWKDGFVLVEGSEGSNFGRIVLTGSLLSDHKCDNHLYALRDVLKGLPVSQGRESHDGCSKK